MNEKIFDKMGFNSSHEFQFVFLYSYFNYVLTIFLIVLLYLIIIVRILPWVKYQTDDVCKHLHFELGRTREQRRNTVWPDHVNVRMGWKSNSWGFLFNRPRRNRESLESKCEEPVLTNMDISTGHMVLSYMEDHLRNKYRLDQEWLALCSYEAEPSTSVLVALKAENQEKNRFGDILPYDHSRVLLNAMANTTGSDYINASSITDHDPRHPAYIAAQSPVAASVADFWQMVWEQGSVVLVLLTRITENGQELCHKYWPEEGSQLYHIYEVHLVSEHIWCDDYLVRSFYLKNVRTGETRTVTQFHFQSWPENGVPSSTKALLEFRRKVNKSYRGRSCPIVVHCSDGAGRTGTYCLIDMVLHRMAKGAREIDIAATLEHLRDQRPHAVRNKQQFEFVLTAVAEEVHAILRALPQ
nr:EOG090X01LO [Simocephalus serrulatus]